MHDPAADEVRLLLRELPAVDEAAAAVHVAPGEDAARWAASGAMHLTGPADGPPLVPAAPVASRLAAAAAVFTHLTGCALDGPALLGERAALRELTRRGRTSAGGATRLLPARDGWVAVTLSRPEDFELVPAWLHEARVDRAGDDWAAVATAAATTPAGDLAARGQELGLAVGAVPAPGGEPDVQLAARHDASRPRPWLLHPSSGPVPRQPLRVLDLSTLWAGPLCAQLLGLAGADVVTVDSLGRPDGARRGDPALFALLHRHARTQPLDLRRGDGQAQLRELVDAADVVITSARPRALARLGLDPAADVARRPGLTWVAVTGYGLTGPWRDRVAYGDDAAAAGGLVAGDPPVFCADAAGDPATGLYAAVAALAVARAGGGLVDVALREVAHHLARPPHRTAAPEVVPTADGWSVVTPAGPVPVAPPRARG